MDLTSSTNKLLVIGWDAADWQIIDPLIQAGKMPHLQRLIEQGVRSPLKTIEPKLSPLLWTSIATGKVASKHGILNFVEPKPDGEGLRVSQSTSRKTKAVWNIFSQNGIDTWVVGWYASHPAEPIRGAVVTNLLHEGFQEIGTEAAPMPPLSVHPSALHDGIAASRLHYQHFPQSLLQQLVSRYKEVGEGDDRIVSLKKRMSYAVSIEAAAIQLMGQQTWKAGFVFFDAIDTMGHLFMQYRKPQMQHVTDKELRWFSDTMDEVYCWHDASLGRLLAAAGNDVDILLVSDHGFHSGAMRPSIEHLPPERRMELESSWHRPFGILVASGNRFIGGITPGPCSILDITPTCLSLLGLPIGKDMDGRALKEIFATQNIPAPIDSWDLIDGDHGLHPEDMRSNPIETSAAIQQLIDLGYLAAIPESTREQIDLVERESTFNLAVSHMSMQQFGKAAELFEKLQAHKSDIVRYTICLAQCKMALYDFKGAMTIAETAFAENPDNIELLLMLCNGYTELENTKKAEEYTRTAESACAGKQEYALSLASLFFLQHRYSQAESHAKRALSINKQDPLAHTLLGKITLASGKFEQAAGHALDALELTQAVPEAHLLLGVALLWLGDGMNAMQSFRNALHFDDKLKDAHRFAGMLLTKIGQGKEATYHLQKAEELRMLHPVSFIHEHPFGAKDFAMKNNLPF